MTTDTTLTTCWQAVADAVPQAKVITWDGCHKIYLAMDDEQVAEFRDLGYADDPALFQMVTDPHDAMTMLHDWYDASCGLRFINAVVTNHADPNAGYTRLIPQIFVDDEN